MTSLPAHNDLVDLKNAVQQIIAGADQLLLEAFGNVTATRKSDGSLVTQADHAVDEYVTTQLQAAFPDHALLSEERNTIYDPQIPFTWVIDPLDGTTNFARGVPIWGVSVALLFYGLPVIGLLSFVSLREQYEAIINMGASYNGRALLTDESIEADNQHFMMLCTRTPRRYRIDTPLKPRILGSATYHIASVARGNALLAIESTPKLWDIAAALLILTEAGGTYRSLDNRPAIFPLAAERHNYERTSFPLMVAANQSILDKLEIDVI